MTNHHCLRLLRVQPQAKLMPSNCSPWQLSHEFIIGYNYWVPFSYIGSYGNSTMITMMICCRLYKLVIKQKSLLNIIQQRIVFALLFGSKEGARCWKTGVSKMRKELPHWRFSSLRPKWLLKTQTGNMMRYSFFFLGGNAVVKIMQYILQENRSTEPDQ